MEDLMLDNIVMLVKIFNGRNVFRANEKFIFDRFKVLAPPPDFPYIFKDFTKPKHTDKTIVEIAKERAKELGEIDLAWSGGVDSTFILAIYKDLGIKINPILFKERVNVSAPLLEYVSNNFDLQTKDLSERGENKLYTGSVADILFDSVARRTGAKKEINGKIVIVDIPNPPYNENIPWLEEYADFLGVKLETHDDILRIIILCFKYYFYCYWCGLPALLGSNQESFYDTQEFTDYAFTNCWHRQGMLKTDSTYKKIQKDYIKQVFGDDFGVAKNE